MELRGTLDVKLPPQARKKAISSKVWQRWRLVIKKTGLESSQLMVTLIPNRERESEEILQLSGGITLYLRDIILVDRTASRSHAFAFVILATQQQQWPSGLSSNTNSWPRRKVSASCMCSTSQIPLQPLLFLAGRSETESHEWMGNIRAMLWPPSPTKRTIDERSYEVSVIAGCTGYPGLYGLLVISPKSLSVYDTSTGILRQQWALASLRKAFLARSLSAKDENKILVLYLNSSSGDEKTITVFCSRAVELLEYICCVVHVQKTLRWTGVNSNSYSQQQAKMSGLMYLTISIGLSHVFRPSEMYSESSSANLVFHFREGDDSNMSSPLLTHSEEVVIRHQSPDQSAEVPTTTTDFEFHVEDTFLNRSTATELEYHSEECLSTASDAHSQYWHPNRSFENYRSPQYTTIYYGSMDRRHLTLPSMRRSSSSEDPNFDRDQVKHNGFEKHFDISGYRHTTRRTTRKSQQATEDSVDGQLAETGSAIYEEIPEPVYNTSPRSSELRGPPPPLPPRRHMRTCPIAVNCPSIRVRPPRDNRLHTLQKPRIQHSSWNEPDVPGNYDANTFPRRRCTTEPSDRDVKTSSSDASGRRVKTAPPLIPFPKPNYHRNGRDVTVAYSLDRRKTPRERKPSGDDDNALPRDNKICPEHWMEFKKTGKNKERSLENLLSMAKQEMICEKECFRNAAAALKDDDDDVPRRRQSEKTEAKVDNRTQQEQLYVYMASGQDETPERNAVLEEPVYISVKEYQQIFEDRGGISQEPTYLDMQASSRPVETNRRIT